MHSTLVICFHLVWSSAVLAYGANGTTQVNVIAILSSALLVAAVMFAHTTNAVHPTVKIGTFAYLLVALWALVQTLPLPAGLANPAWLVARQFDIPVTSSTISLAPSITISSIQRLAIPFNIFLSGLHLFTDDHRAKRALRTIVYLSSVIAFIGLIQFLFAPDVLIFSEKSHYLDSYTFPFINRNTAATFIGLTIICTIAEIQQEWKRYEVRSAFQNFVNINGRLNLANFFPIVLLVVLLVVDITALALTKSRGGIGASVLALCVFFGWLAIADAGKQRPSTTGGRVYRRSSIAGIVLYIAVVALIALLISSRAIYRGQVQGFDDTRLCILPSLLSALERNWSMGGGLGAFYWIFAPYRDPSCGVAGYWDKAHNFYLDGVIALGVAFIIAACACLTALISTYASGYKNRRSMRIYPIAGLATVVLVGVHSLVDFSLQIPGLAAFYAAIAALTICISVGRNTQGRGGKSFISVAPRTAITQFIICGLSVLVISIALKEIKDRFVARHFALLTNALERENVVSSETKMLLASAHFEAALSTCDRVTLDASLSALLLSADRLRRDASYEEWAERVGEAEKQVRYNLSCYPADGNYWLGLAMLNRAGGEQPHEQAALMSVSQRYSPADELMIIARLVHWNRLSKSTLLLAREAVYSDVLIGMQYVSPENLAPSLTHISESLSRSVSDVAAILPADRIKHLTQSGVTIPSE